MEQKKDKRLLLTEIQLKDEIINGIVVSGKEGEFEILADDNGSISCIARVKVKRRGRRFHLSIDNRENLISRIFKR